MMDIQLKLHGRCLLSMRQRHFGVYTCIVMLSVLLTACAGTSTRISGRPLDTNWPPLLVKVNIWGWLYSIADSLRVVSRCSVSSSALSNPPFLPSRSDLGLGRGFLFISVCDKADNFSRCICSTSLGKEIDQRLLVAYTINPLTSFCSVFTIAESMTLSLAALGF